MKQSGSYGCWNNRMTYRLPARWYDNRIVNGLGEGLHCHVLAQPSSVVEEQLTGV